VSTSRFLSVSVSVWTLAVIASFGARLALVSAPMSLTEGLAWGFVAGAPAAIVVAVFRSPSSSTIAQVLYDAEHTGDTTRRS